jgi:hypothetical protein
MGGGENAIFESGELKRESRGDGNMEPQSEKSMWELVGGRKGIYGLRR